MTEPTVRIEHVATAYPRADMDQADPAAAVSPGVDEPGQPMTFRERAIWLATPPWLRSQLMGMSLRQRAAWLATPPWLRTDTKPAATNPMAPLSSIEGRNRVYVEAAPALAESAARKVLPASAALAGIRCLVTSSCTGFNLPGWGAALVERLPLPNDTVRVPLTEAGCAGAVLALAQAADHVRLRPGPALVVALELSSLAHQRENGADGDTVAAVPVIFGDGAGAAYLVPGEGPGLEVIDSSTFLVPGSREVFAFRLADKGFYPILERRLGELLPEPAAAAIAALLGRHGLVPDDVAAWLVHPGGASILTNLEQRLAIPRERMRWSWQSMQADADMSAAGIFEVLAHYLEDSTAPGGWGVVVAFGPGVTIELLLVKRTG